MIPGKRRYLMRMAFGFAMAAAVAVHAEQVKLAWDAPRINLDGSPFTNLAGYVVYGGTAPGHYEFSVNAGTNTQAVITGLQAGVTHYFSIAAFNAWNCSSGLSEEITVGLTSPARSGCVISIL
jgi:hypothetical protein